MRDYANSEARRRNPYCVIKCDCGRILDEIRYELDSATNRADLIPREVGWVIDANVSMHTKKPFNRYAVSRDWTKSGRRWVCPCGQEWRKKTRSLLAALVLASANRSIGTKSGDRSPELVIGVDF